MRIYISCFALSFFTQKKRPFGRLGLAEISVYTMACFYYIIADVACQLCEREQDKERGGFCPLFLLFASLIGIARVLA